MNPTFVAFHEFTGRFLHSESSAMSALSSFACAVWKVFVEVNLLPCRPLGCSAVVEHPLVRPPARLIEFINRNASENPDPELRKS